MGEECTRKKMGMETEESMGMGFGPGGRMGGVGLGLGGGVIFFREKNTCVC